MTKGNPLTRWAKTRLITFLVAALMIFAFYAYASGPNFNDTTLQAVGSQNPTFTGNFGVGTTTPVNGTAFMNGNVGIGTWSATARLQVAGSVLATSFYGDGSNLTGISGGSTGWTDGGTNVYPSTTTDFIAIGTTTPASALTVKGNVGIGTTLPYQTIAAPANGMVVEGNVGIGTFSASSAKLTVMGGSVGIGTTAPSASFTLNNLADVSTSTSFLNLTNANFVIGGSGVNTDGAGSRNGLFSITTPTWVDAGGVNLNGFANASRGGAYALSMIGYTGSAAPGTGFPAVYIGAGKLNAGNNQMDTALSSTDIILSIGNSANIGGVAGNQQFNFSGGGNLGIGTTDTLGGLVVLSGNVGLGTWNPSSGLTIRRGNVAIGTTTPYLRIPAPTNGMAIEGNVGVGTWAASGGKLLVVGGNVGVGTVTPVGALTIMNGNVGIGTWSPTSRLQVIGTVNATAFIGDGSGLTGISANSGWTDGGTNVYTLTTTDNVGIGTTTPTAALLVENAGTQDSFRVNDAVADGSPFVIDASGNVGIGTTVPLVEVHVTSNKNAVTALAVSNLDTGAAAESSVLVGTDAGYLTYGIHGSGFSTPGLGYVWTTASSPLYFGTNATTRMVIGASGNIGIGTTDPVGAFTVMSGNVGIGTWSPTSRLQVIGTVNATAFVGDGSGLTGISAGGWTDGGTNVYTSTTADNVGIGTTTPNAATLEVVKNAVQSLVKVSSTATGAGDYLLIDSAGNVGIGTTKPVGALTVLNGFVGIGTTSPNYPLEVYGDGVSGDTVMIKTTSSTGVGTILFANNASTVGGAIGGYTDGSFNVGGTNDFKFHTGTSSSGWGTERMRILSGDGSLGIGTALPVRGTTIMNGNVGIGTWSPGSGLMIRRGNVGIGTTTSYLRIAAPTNGMAVEGNVGIGTWAAANGKLIVMGGNVGIGTTVPVGALVVMNGNVGIGTKSPASELDVNGSIITRGSSGSVFSEGGLMVMANVTQTLLDSGYTAYGTRIYANQSNVVPLTVLGVSGQTADLLNIKDGNNNIVSTVLSNGNIGVGTLAPVGALTVLSGNVGVGTWSPTSRLQVVGTVTATSFAGDGSGLTGISAGGWTDGGTNVYTSTTTDQVAIGTTTPSSSLTVKGNVGIGTTTPYRTIAAPANGMIVEGNVGIGTFAAAGGKLIVMGGNVGVGTLAPSFAIEVNGVGNANGDLGAAYYTSSSSSYANNRFVNSNGTDVWFGIGGTGVSLAPYRGRGYMASQGGLTFVADSSSADIRFFGGVSGTYTEWARFDANGNLGIGTTTPLVGLAVMNGNVGIGTWNAVNRLSIVGNIGIGTTLPYRRIAAPNNGMVVEGNVGIGTWNPSKKLQVSGDVLVRTPVNSTTAFDVETSNGTSILTVDTTTSYTSLGGGLSAANQISGINGDATTPSFTFLNDQDTGMFGSGGNNLLGFTTNGVERVRIIASGNVGVGTTDPVGGLSVMNGNVGIGTWSPTTALQVVGTVTASSFAGDGSGLTGISAGGWTDGGTNVYTSTTTDNVGIGTTTPKTTFEIVKSSNRKPLMISATAAGQGNYMVIGSDGNVGIGTTTAADQFVIYKAFNPGLRLDNGGLNSLVFTNGSGGNEINSNGDGGSTVADLRILVGDSVGNPERIRIVASTGSIGIGTSSPLGGTSIMNGNVGIGTWNPASGLTIRRGNVGVGTTLPYLRIAAPTNGMAIEGNVGIGTWAANEKLIIVGGNVGIGTVTPVGALTVLNGNVGLGTWSPRARLEVKNSLSYSTIYDNGNSSTSITVDWTRGNVQKVTMTGNCTFTFTAPGGIARLTLQLTQDGTGGRTATWPAAVKWPGASAPVLTTTASAVDFVSCLYDGTNYYCTDSLDFR